MRKLTMTLAAAALALGTMAMTASAQTQHPGAAIVHTQIQNASPVQQAACRRPGRWCPTGYVRACAPLRGCWCRPCW